jgi:MYXO-CTERM domain-containing protein
VKNNSATLKKHDQTNLVQKLWNARSAFALVLAITVLPACNQLTRQEARNTTAENVAENTNQYVGRTVTIRSEAIRKLGPSTFTMSSQQFLGGEPIIIVNASGTPFVFPENEDVDVQVTGQVRQFVLADINRQYSLGLGADLYREYENRPAIIAQSIALAPNPGQISQNPARYYGRTIAVTGEVEDVRSPNAFTLDEDQLVGQDLLVINSNTGQAIQDDQTLAVTGVLRPFVVAELEREYDFNWDQGFVQQLEAEYRDRPVLIATGIYPSALPEDGGELWGLLGLAGLIGLFGFASGRRRRDDNRRDLRDDVPAYRNPSIR